ncbi:MAG: glycosyl transferase, partial [Planctomycetota bacterium]
VACRAASRLVIDNGALADHIGARAKVGQHSVLSYGAETLDEPLCADAVKAFGLEPGAYDLLVCRFEPENHVDEILRAHEAAATGRPLVAVAHTDTGTPYAVRTMARARAASEDGRVRFLGAIYDPEVLLPLRQHAALYLHGHSVGGTNPSLLEAMGAGNVVLAHDNPFNREVLGDQDVYWDGVESLVDRIGSWAVRAEAEIAAVQERNRRRIAEAYSWDRLSDDYAALIRSDAGR